MKRSGKDKSQPLYMIGTVSEMLGMHPQTLRGYDRKGILSPKRSDGNTRLYSEEDIEKLKFILTLSRDLGVNLAGVEVIMRMRSELEKALQQIALMKDLFEKYTGQNVEDVMGEGLVKVDITSIVQTR